MCFYWNIDWTISVKTDKHVHKICYWYFNLYNVWQNLEAYIWNVIFKYKISKKINKKIKDLSNEYNTAVSKIVLDIALYWTAEGKHINEQTV